MTFLRNFLVGAVWFVSAPVWIPLGLVVLLVWGLAKAGESVIAEFRA